MKRAFTLCILGVLLCLAASSSKSAQSDNKARDNAAGSQCPFRIVGLWRTTAISQHNPLLFDFLPNGSVVLMEYAPNSLPQDFEQVDSVGYTLNSPAKPQFLEFWAVRGNDIFVQGVTLLKILGYNNDSFTTEDRASGEKTRWVRERTHRYFLTFAARGGQPQQGGPAFVSWTTMDGRETTVDALGAQPLNENEAQTKAVFGRIAPEVYRNTIERKDKKENKDDIVLMRFELDRGEFEETHEIFEQWERQAERRRLQSDPYVDTLRFILKVVDRLRPCGNSQRIKKPERTAIDEISAKSEASHRPFEFIRLLRKKNSELHVSDEIFPWDWRPSVSAGLLGPVPNASPSSESENHSATNQSVEPNGRLADRSQSSIAD